MSKYVRGPSTYRDPHATVETKPTPTLRDSAHYDTDPQTRSRYDTGGGYERIRSYEHDPTKPGDRKRDVYAYIHRLCAVAWLLPEDAPLSALDGVDVHHRSGVEWDNREENVELLEHGRHSEVTQAQMRAYAEDAKRRVERDESRGIDHPDECDRCGEESDLLAESDDWTGQYCIECSKAAYDGATIEVV